MTTAKKKRKSTSSIRIDTNVRCKRIYPVADGKQQDKALEHLKTVGIKFSREQALHLARVLLAATQDWEEIDVTAWRTRRRKTDGTYMVTVTSQVQLN